MRRRLISWTARIGLLVAVGALVGGLAPAAFAQGGVSTPGVVVTAMNPGTANGFSTMKIALSAHTASNSAATLSNPSCRPQDMTLRCWGSLVLRIPAYGGLSVTGFQVHRVAVGDVNCSGDDEGDCGDESGMSTTAISPAAEPAASSVQAQVNGIAYLVDPGNSGLPSGSEVQLKITLTDNGSAHYGDLADVQVNQFTSGPDKPLLYDTGEQVIQQVAIHSIGPRD